MTIKELKAKMTWIDESEWLQHENGGGWKHKTAIVPDSVFLPSDSSIGNDSSIGDRASIGHRVRIGDGVRIGHRASIGEWASIGSGYTGAVLCIQASGHQITTCMPTREVQIGCKRHTIEWWLSHFQEVGSQEGYSKKQIAEYGSLLHAVREWLDVYAPKQGV